MNPPRVHAMSCVGPLSGDGRQSIVDRARFVQASRPESAIRRLYYATGSPERVSKLLDILAALDRSSGPEGMDLPRSRLLPRRCRVRELACYPSLRGRIRRRFDYVDYH